MHYVCRPTVSRCCGCIAILGLLLTSSVGLAQNARLSDWDAQPAIHYTVSVSPDDLTFDSMAGYDIPHLTGAISYGNAGEPQLPIIIVRLAVPAGMQVTDVQAIPTETVEIPGTYSLFPAQPPRRISDPDPAGDFVLPADAVYSLSTPWPAQLATFTHENDLAGQAIAHVRVSPLQYIPAEGRLLLNTHIELVLTGTSGYVCRDYLPVRISEDARLNYEHMVSTLVNNPADVSLTVNPAPQQSGVTPDTYDYVIITQSSWVDDFQSLADWKTKRGNRAAIVTTDWIFGSSSGYIGTNQAKLRSFVQDAHNNWGTVCFLLGGDTSVVPYHTLSLLGDDIPNDTYYSDFDDDWLCEVYIGRAPARTSTDVATFTNKVLTYEKNPPLTNYAECAAFFGFDLKEAGSGEGEGMMAYIAWMILPESWDYRREYDSEAGTHKADVIAYLNQGNNLINHSDHSNTDVMGAGYTNHGDLLSVTDMSNLTNGDRQSILYTLGCWACNYASYTCIAEAFVRNANGGGVAFMGNSRYGWYSPGQIDGLSATYDQTFFSSLFDRNIQRVGPCFADHKNMAYIADQYYQYIFTELTLLGDPEMPMWTVDPQTLTVTHPATLGVSVENEFVVQVFDGTTPKDDVPVCLSKDGDIYEVLRTGPDGLATFHVTPTSLGTLSVAVRKHNYLPVEQTAEVVDAVMRTLTVTTSGSGSVTLAPDSGTYTDGTTVQLTAIPAEGWCFDEWTGALTGSTNPENVLMNGDKAVNAGFALDCNGNDTPDADDISTGASTDYNGSGIPDECEGLGDLDCSGSVDLFDVDAFVLALTSSNDEPPFATYSATYPGCDGMRGDIDGSGDVDLFDIDSFVAMVTD